jgi:serine/threonine protein kinase
VSATLLEGATHRTTNSMGTINHMAPEVLKHGRLTKQADIYSFGVMSEPPD